MGQPGQRHILAFSWLSGTGLPKNFTNTTLGLRLISLFDLLRTNHNKNKVNLREKDKRSTVHIVLWMVVKILSAFIMMPIPAYCQNQTCPKCDSQVPQGSNYCNICGTPLNQPFILRICSRCKTRIAAEAHFCPECGHKQ